MTTLENYGFYLIWRECGVRYDGRANGNISVVSRRFMMTIKVHKYFLHDTPKRMTDDKAFCPASCKRRRINYLCDSDVTNRITSGTFLSYGWR